MQDALIPIGSVVRLKGQDWLAVILGFYPRSNEILFDYLAAPYPMGLATQEGALFGNADAIEEVVSRGYLDEQGEETLGALVEYMNAEAQAYIEDGRELERLGLLHLEEEPPAGESTFKME